MMQVSRWRAKFADEKKFIDSIVLAALRNAGIEADENHRAKGTGENEWYTRAEYIEAARKVFRRGGRTTPIRPAAESTTNSQG